ncbi:hypothetical protein, partial [Thermoflexibacter ruber]
TELGLHHYDFSARSYDYQINRTTTLDPHGDRYVSVSPYSFLNNNPLRYIDPTGRDVTVHSEDYISMSGQDARNTLAGLKKVSKERGWNRQSNDENSSKKCIPCEKFMEKVLKPVKEFFKEFVSQFNPAEDKKEMYESVKQGEPAAIKKKEKREQQTKLLAAIPTSIPEVSPYIAISVGKQSQEQKQFSGYWTTMITTSGLYSTIGYDRTYAWGSPKTSYSISMGVIIGSHDGIEGWGVGWGAGAGRFGFESSRGVNLDYPPFSIPYPKPQMPIGVQWGNTATVGLTYSNTPAYVTGNLGYTFKLPLD